MEDHEEEEKDLEKPDDGGQPLEVFAYSRGHPDLLQDAEEEGDPDDLDHGQHGQKVVPRVEVEKVDYVAGKGVEDVGAKGALVNVSLPDDPSVEDRVLRLHVKYADPEVQQNVSYQQQLEETVQHLEEGREHPHAVSVSFGAAVSVKKFGVGF